MRIIYRNNRTQTASFNKSINLRTQNFIANNMARRSGRDITTPSVNKGGIKAILKRRRNKSTVSSRQNTENIGTSHQGFLK